MKTQPTFLFLLNSHQNLFLPSSSSTYPNFFPNRLSFSSGIPFFFLPRILSSSCTFEIFKIPHRRSSSKVLRNSKQQNNKITKAKETKSRNRNLRIRYYKNNTNTPVTEKKYRRLSTNLLPSSRLTHTPIKFHVLNEQKLCHILSNHLTPMLFGRTSIPPQAHYGL